MIKQIEQQLAVLKEKHDIKILMAIESGSRAWGFPSPDSDYDIRIIYIHKKEWYLSVNDKKDALDIFIGKEIDINGWDIRKALRLLAKSNVTPFEWAQSPIVYSEEKGFRTELLDLARAYFNPYYAFNHYKGIAKNSFKNSTENGEIKLKKLFYVLRPLFAIKWIIKYESLPPMDIFSLLEAEDNAEIKKIVLDLIELKATANEDYVHTINPLLNSFIVQSFEMIQTIQWTDKNKSYDLEPLNQQFRKLLQQYNQ